MNDQEFKTALIQELKNVNENLESISFKLDNINDTIKKESVFLGERIDDHSSRVTEGFESIPLSGVDTEEVREVLDDIFFQV